MWWADPSPQPAAARSLPHVPSRTRQRIGRAKVKKRVGQDKDSEISEGKRKKKTKAMQRQSLTATSHKETDALPPSEQWPCPRYLAPVLLPSMTLCRKEYPSGHLGPAVHVVSLPDFLSPPSLLEAIKRGSLVTVRVLLSNSKSTGLATNQNTARATLKNMSSTPARLSTAGEVTHRVKIVGVNGKNK